MKATLIEKREIYIQCPTCSDESSHLLSSLDPDTPFGPWYCSNCGTGIRGYIESNGVVEITMAEDRKEPTYILLRINLQDDPIYLIVSGADFIAQDRGIVNEETDEERFFNSDEFFYNHECHPNIILQNTIAIIRNVNTNPRSIFEYVVTKPLPYTTCEYDEKDITEDMILELLQFAEPNSQL